MKPPKFIFIVNNVDMQEEEYPVAFFLSQEEAELYCSCYGMEAEKIMEYPIMQFCKNK
jgi:hypothetical protein